MNDSNIGPTGFGFSSTAEEVTEGLDLSGTTWLVTGCNSGLGLETTRILHARGGHVIGLARTVAKAANAFAELGMGEGDGTPIACELSDLASVRRAVDSVCAIDRRLQGIIDRLTDRGRVVMLSSGAHRMAHEQGIEFDNLSGERDYHPWRLYGNSKLANLLFARSLARRFAGEAGSARPTRSTPASSRPTWRATSRTLQPCTRASRTR